MSPAGAAKVGDHSATAANHTGYQQQLDDVLGRGRAVPETHQHRHVSAHRWTSGGSGVSLNPAPSWVELLEEAVMRLGRRLAVGVIEDTGQQAPPEPATPAEAKVETVPRSAEVETVPRSAETTCTEEFVVHSAEH